MTRRKMMVSFKFLRSQCGEGNPSYFRNQRGKYRVG
jgi:hypothetical protein